MDSSQTSGQYRGVPAAQDSVTAEAAFAERRREMVDRQLRARGIRDPHVLAAIGKVPRHIFVPAELREEAYKDQPLPIGAEQTISQPYIVASMTELLGLTGTDRVLEIGAGSGYQTAILAELAVEVHTVEEQEALAAAAAQRLEHLGYANAHVHIGDGTLGWPEAAPYDAILITAAAPFLPPPLVQQLADGGCMVLPLGSADAQTIVRVRRSGRDIATEPHYACRFVPLLGRYGWREEDPRG